MFERKKQNEGAVLSENSKTGSSDFAHSTSSSSPHRSDDPSAGSSKKQGENMSRDTSKSHASAPCFETTIAKGVTVTGNIVCEAGLKIFGVVVGDIAGRDVCLEEGSLVQGKIEGISVAVYGSVEGTVDADTVRIFASGSLDGEIVCRTIAVDEGAFLSGVVGRRTDDQKHFETSEAGFADVSSATASA